MELRLANVALLLQALGPGHWLLSCAGNYTLALPAESNGNLATIYKELTT